MPRAPHSCFTPHQLASIGRRQIDEHMLQPYVSYVSDVYCICFIWMFTKVDLVLHMLQWLYTYVANVCFKTYVASVLFGYCTCCSGYTCMLQVYVSYVSPILDLYCKCFIWMLAFSVILQIGRPTPATPLRKRGVTCTKTTSLPHTPLA
jgi:hypothetical protein